MKHFILLSLLFIACGAPASFEDTSLPVVVDELPVVAQLRADLAVWPTCTTTETWQVDARWCTLRQCSPGTCCNVCSWTLVNPVSLMTTPASQLGLGSGTECDREALNTFLATQHIDIINHCVER